jgi:hypothetical protein
MQHDCSSQIYTDVPSHNKLPHYFGFVAYGFRNRKVLRSLNVSTRQHSMSLFTCFCRIICTSFLFLWFSQSQSTTFKFSMIQILNINFTCFTVPIWILLTTVHYWWQTSQQNVGTVSIWPANSSSPYVALVLKSLHTTGLGISAI